MSELTDRIEKLKAISKSYYSGTYKDMYEVLTDCQSEIERLERSMADHFTNEHLAGDGPEIDRWKLKVKRLERQLEAAETALNDIHAIAAPRREHTGFGMIRNISRGYLAQSQKGSK